MHAGQMVALGGDRPPTGAAAAGAGGGFPPRHTSSLSCSGGSGSHEATIAAAAGGAVPQGNGAAPDRSVPSTDFGFEFVDPPAGACNLATSIAVCILHDTLEVHALHTELASLSHGSHANILGYVPDVSLASYLHFAPDTCCFWKIGLCMSISGGAVAAGFDGGPGEYVKVAAPLRPALPRARPPPVFRSLNPGDGKPAKRRLSMFGTPEVDRPVPAAVEFSGPSLSLESLVLSVLRLRQVMVLTRAQACR